MKINGKFRKCFDFTKKALPFLIAAAVLLSVIFFPKPVTEAEAEKRVVRIWNVDTFEGGKGSRTAFLRRVALMTERENEGVYYLITSYTQEGAVSAFEEGRRPDMLSFGIGLSVFAEQSLPLSRSFSGGETEEGCLAYPWCSGRYSLFSLTDNFDEAGATAISKGGNNLSEVAAALAGVDGEQVESTAAYVGFLNGTYRYLLGTQRDECHFASRGANVYSRPLNEYCDLYQYISILSAEKRADCNAFLEMLLSDEAQELLSGIGMYPVDEACEKTVSVFTEKEALRTLSQMAANGEPIKNLDKFLKTI